MSIADAGYYDGLNQRLLDALPNARNVLELGCANGRLGRRYKELHPEARWTGVDIVAGAVETASSYLDAVHLIDVESGSLDAVGSSFETIVIGDMLEHIREPERLLTRLLDLSTADAKLVCCIPNMSHISVLVFRLVNSATSLDLA
jgi:2-polyprenyl-3-methyl-5-hydroxy-6-metoxy-1,4-benzoquinol methylase